MSRCLLPVLFGTEDIRADDVNGDARHLGDGERMAWRDLPPAADCGVMTMNRLPHFQRAASHPDDVLCVHSPQCGTIPHWKSMAMWEESAPLKFS